VASRFTELVIDSHDCRLLALFWCDVLGYRILEETDATVEIGAAEFSVEGVRSGPVPPTLVFVPVPEDKIVKNRVHIDVSPIDRDHDSEVQRLFDLGARPVDIGQGTKPWTVMADPEGNEFCVLRSFAPQP
jgi:catechol 2,3-dioxygenase-like lactoylglutathione lyase family enzyme